MADAVAAVFAGAIVNSSAVAGLLAAHLRMSTDAELRPAGRPVVGRAGGHPGGRRVRVRAAAARRRPNAAPAAPVAAGPDPRRRRRMTVAAVDDGRGTGDPIEPRARVGPRAPRLPRSPGRRTGSGPQHPALLPARPRSLPGAPDDRRSHRRRSGHRTTGRRSPGDRCGRVTRAIRRWPRPPRPGRWSPSGAGTSSCWPRA